MLKFYNEIILAFFLWVVDTSGQHGGKLLNNRSKQNQILKMKN